MALPQGVLQQQLQALASQGLTLQPTGQWAVTSSIIHNSCPSCGDVNWSLPPAVYREIFAPVLFSPLSPLLSVGEFKAGPIPMIQIISL